MLELKDPLLKLPDVDELLELLLLLEEELELLLLLEELELLLELPLLKEPLLKPLVDLLTLDFPPLDLKLLLELLLLELLNPPELLKLLDPFDFASTTVSPWVILSKIGIVSTKMLHYYEEMGLANKYKNYTKANWEWKSRLDNITSID